MVFEAKYPDHEGLECHMALQDKDFQLKSLWCFIGLVNIEQYLEI